MNPPLDIRCGAPDPTSAPLNVVELFALIDAHLTGEILGDYLPYIMSSTTPSMENTDKIWLQLDSNGRPIAFKKYYAGRWRRVYNGMLGEIRLFSGDPHIGALWDADGKGMPEKEYDGWQICNGNNGSPDLSNKFIFAGDMAGDDGGYTSAWKAKVEQENGDLVATATGGAQRTMIEAKHLPELDLVLHGHEAKDGIDHSPDYTPIIDVEYANAKPHDVTLGHYGADPDGSPAVPQVKYPTVPPFIAMGYIIFIGYS